MTFSSMTFLVYFLPAAVLIYYFLHFTGWFKNVWLFIASLVFCILGQFIYLPLFLLLLFLNWMLGLILSQRFCKQKKTGAILTAAVILNAGILLFFKQAKVIGGLFQALGISDPGIGAILLPTGLSFFVLQALSYLMDVAAGRVRGEKNIFYLGLYCMFFPKLAAGPLVDYQKLRAQIGSRKHSIEKVSEGICRFVTGLGKQVLLANTCGSLADYVFNFSAMGAYQITVPVTLSWLGLAAFVLQIYYELSGYADMAIGLGKVFGFDLPENFHYPYTAMSVTEFWSRFNNTLIRWFREYVYIPMNQRFSGNKDRAIINYAITWILIGFWHGAGWNVFFFGVFQFAILLAEKFFDADINTYKKLHNRVFTLVFVGMSFVLLRTENLYQAGRFFMNLTGLSSNGFFSSTALVFLKENAVWLFFAVLFAGPAAPKLGEYLAAREKPLLQVLANLCYTTGVVVILLLCLIHLHFYDVTHSFRICF